MVQATDISVITLSSWSLTFQKNKLERLALFVFSAKAFNSRRAVIGYCLMPHSRPQ